MKLFKKSPPKTCKTCKFFVIMSSNEFAGIGRCKRFPPAFNIVELHCDLSACGEYKKGKNENKKK